MTKYFQRNKNINEPFACHNCQQEKNNIQWFTVLTNKNKVICSNCRKKWYQQNYQFLTISTESKNNFSPTNVTNNIKKNINFNNSECGVYFKSSEKMTEIENNAIDLIITSPPYFNIKNYSKNGTQDLIHSSLREQDVGNINSYPNYISSLLKIWKECEKILKPNGKLCINVPLLPMLKEKFKLFDVWKNMIYINAGKHAVFTQSKKTDLVLLSFHEEKDDIIISDIEKNNKVILES